MERVRIDSHGHRRPVLWIHQKGTCFAEFGDVTLKQSGDSRVVTDGDHHWRNLATRLLPRLESLLPCTSELLERAIGFGEVVGERVGIVVSLTAFRERGLDVLPEIPILRYRLAGVVVGRRAWDLHETRFDGVHKARSRR